MARKYKRYVTDEKLKEVNPNNKKVVDRFLDFKRMKLSESSIYNYESDFNQFLVYISEEEANENIMDKNVEELADLIEGYMAFCARELGNNERRIERRMSSLSSFFQYLKKRRKMKENPIELLERMRVRAGEKAQVHQTYLTKEQYAEIRKKLDAKGDIQLRTFFEVASSTLARVNALAHIKVDNIDLEKKRIYDVLEKEGKVVTLFLSDSAVEWIKKWMAQRQKEGIENEYLFVTSYRGEMKAVSKGTIQNGWIKRIGELIDVNLHTHDLRHSGASIMYHSGVPLEVVSKILNHEGTDVTMKHYIEDNHDDLQDKIKDFEI